MHHLTLACLAPAFSCRLFKPRTDSLKASNASRPLQLRLPWQDRSNTALLTQVEATKRNLASEEPLLHS